MEKYVEVYAAQDITFAYLMKANLEDAGIPTQIDNENLQNLYCLDGMVPRVLVPESQVQQARQIMAELRQAAENTPEVDDQEQ
jgi:hypothetical protein